MCILFIAVDEHPDYPLIIAANRDEFYARPTAASEFWPDENTILAGKDLQSGGTWMGINRNGHLAALTNYRDPTQLNNDCPSRGQLVSDYLLTMDSAYDEILKDTSNDYNGYNLLYGHWRDLRVFNNTDNTLHKLTRGFYGLSNAYLNTPWPKVSMGTELFRDYCQSAEHIQPEGLFDLLMDGRKAAPDDLPDTGIGHEWEHILSSIFIQSPDYGTRSSTVLLIDNNGHSQWFERSLDATGNFESEQAYAFDIEE
jgi:uncharacterized protein with NRDE domain